jgi:hypothetical protein
LPEIQSSCFKLLKRTKFSLNKSGVPRYLPATDPPRPLNSVNSLQGPAEYTLPPITTDFILPPPAISSPVKWDLSHYLLQQKARRAELYAPPPPRALSAPHVHSTGLKLDSGPAQSLTLPPMLSFNSISPADAVGNIPSLVNHDLSSEAGRPRNGCTEKKLLSQHSLLDTRNNSLQTPQKRRATFSSEFSLNAERQPEATEGTLTPPRSATTRSSMRLSSVSPTLSTQEMPPPPRPNRNSEQKDTPEYTAIWGRIYDVERGNAAYLNSLNSTEHSQSHSYIPQIVQGYAASSPSPSSAYPSPAYSSTEWERLHVVPTSQGPHTAQSLSHGKKRSFIPGQNYSKPPKGFVPKRKSTESPEFLAKRHKHTSHVPGGDVLSPSAPEALEEFKANELTDLVTDKDKGWAKIERAVNLGEVLNSPKFRPRLKPEPGQKIFSMVARIIERPASHSDYPVYEDNMVDYVLPPDDAEPPPDFDSQRFPSMEYRMRNKIPLCPYFWRYPPYPV